MLLVPIPIISPIPTTSDKTRFVFNPSVKSGYALGYDAAKFESDNPSIVQIYVIDNNLKYAIKERPIENGKVLIGIKIGNAGKYTIHMNTISHRNFYLYDKLNGDAKVTRMTLVDHEEPEVESEENTEE